LIKIVSLIKVLQSTKTPIEYKMFILKSKVEKMFFSTEKKYPEIFHGSRKQPDRSFIKKINLDSFIFSLNRREKDETPQKVTLSRFQITSSYSHECEKDVQYCPLF